jgi:CRISPR-associated protein Cas5/CasD subtype I-E/CRISPR-associated protein Cas6/Cse3/CasE subtype I-E
MQAWGVQSRFTVRETALEPSRSGVIGLLCAALGRPRDARLDDFASMPMTVRVDREGRLERDYQTAGGVHRGAADGYGVVTADGRAQFAVTSSRYYLADADFLVGLESPDLEWLRVLDAALVRPRWGLFLGRRAFAPAAPVQVGVVPGGVEDTLRVHAWFARTAAERARVQAQCRTDDPPMLRLVVEGPEGATGDLRWDVPLSFADRRFATRTVATAYVRLTPEMIEDDPLCISRLILDARSRLVHRDLADCQQLHRTILGAFPGLDPGVGRPRKQLGVLYRVETDPRRGRIEILVQSRIAPDWSRLPADYLLEPRDGPNPACKPIGERYAAVRAGQVLVFRLRANPTRKIDTKSDGAARRHGRRVELRDEAAQVAWLHRKAQWAGFEILSVVAHHDVPALLARPGGKVTGTRAQPGSRQPQHLTFAAVVFEGMLRVVDPIRFREALEQGIGSGKAYGFGLLSLAPAGRTPA